MKIGFVLFLLLLISFRVLDWKSDVEFTESLCGMLVLPEIEKREFSPIKIRGQGQYSFNNQIELKSPEVFWKGQWRHFNGKISIFQELRIALPQGRKVEVKGRWGCDFVYKNLGLRENGIFNRVARKLVLKKGRSIWLPLPEKNSWNFILEKKFREYLKNMRPLYPNLAGIVWAVWTGETIGLEPKLVALYREGGLLPLVALSGQHVSVLVILFRLFLSLFTGGLITLKGFRKGYKKWLLFLPVLGSGILTITSFGTPSVLRTLAMALALCFLRLKRYFCSPNQVLCSSAAFMIVLDPGLMTGISFVLSLGGTYLLMEISEAHNLSTAFRKYILLSIVMSFLSAPLILFYFGQWSYLSPICTLAVSWLWNLIIIPIGFSVPLLGVLPDSICDAVSRWLDLGWQYLVENQLWVEKWVQQSHGFYPRPTIWETVVLQIGCLLLFKAFLKRMTSYGAM